MNENIWNDENLIKVLSRNGIVVMPTDTIYGIVGKALKKHTVERIYNIKKRNPEKPCIILIGNINELKKFSIVLLEEQKKILEKYWFTPSGLFRALSREVEGFRPTSIILDCPNDEFEYLHRGTKTLAFRLPAPQTLRDLLLKVGPLIAPSANTEARLPSKNIKEAKKYFGDSVDPVRSRSPQGDRSTRFLTRAAFNGVDLYVDGGELKSKASKLIKLNSDGSVIVLRE
ncbi:MAG: Sua5/YciO/YrdC/YwlC family protein [Candidatus Paceibacterota bacterium]